MQTSPLLLLLLALALASCVENEEDWTVRSDGPVTLRVRATGDAEDLAGGYSVPLDGRWNTTSDAARSWRANVGADTGSPGVQESIRNGAFATLEGAADDKLTLGVEASFSSAQEVPTTFATQDEPYRGSYLRRSAQQTTRELGNRRVHVFERRFHSREKRPIDLVEVANEHVPAEFAERLTNGDQLAQAEKRLVIDSFLVPLREANEDVLREVLSSVYRIGDGSLSLEAFENAVAEGRTRIEQVVDAANVLRVWEEIESAQERDDPDVARPLREFRASLRNALREAIRSLARDDVPLEIVHGVLFQLESFFTREDHTADLADEKFRVRIAMPGTIVSGGRLDSDGRAVFEFEGKDLARSDVVLRVVSIEE